MGFLRTLAILVLTYFGVVALRRLLRPKAPPPDPMKRARTVEGADMVRDPACGIYTPRDSAIAAKSNGEAIYFCSERCREDFAAGKRAGQKDS
ncbi:MAG: hypothetical protein ACE5FC_07895 [Myxococcota bacterium]